MSPVSPLIDWRHTPQAPASNVALNVRYSTESMLEK
jgi:hypothetical protein